MTCTIRGSLGIPAPALDSITLELIPSRWSRTVRGMDQYDDTDREEGDEQDADGVQADSGAEGARDDAQATGGARTRRRTVRRVAHPASVTAAESWHGAIPATATRWGIRRRDEDLGWTPPGALAERREWPLEELSEQTISDRWGPGEYRLTWWARQGRGGRHFLGTSAHPVVIRAPVAPERPASAHGSALPPALQDAFSLIGLIEQQSNNKLAAIVQLSQLGTQRNGGGIDAEVIRMIVESGQKQTEALVGAFTEGLRSLERRIESLTEDGGGDEPEAPRATLPGAPAPIFKPGEPISESLKATALNWAASNPDQAASLAKLVLDTVGKIAGAVSGPAPRTRAAATVVRRDPAILVEQKEPAPHVNGAPVATNDPYASAARAQQAPAST